MAEKLSEFKIDGKLFFTREHGDGMITVSDPLKGTKSAKLIGRSTEATQRILAREILQDENQI